MTRQKDLTNDELHRLLMALGSWLANGNKQFTALPMQCELPHCYNAVQVAVRDPFTNNAPRYICRRCAKLAVEMTQENPAMRRLNQEGW